MDLQTTIEFIRDHRKDLTLFNLTDDRAIVDELASYFRTQNLRIRSVRTASGRPREIAVLGSRGEVLETVEVSLLRELVDSDPTASDVGIADAEYGEILRHLKETTFTSYDTEQLLYASREIEDRARRVGRGTVHAGFQRVSVMDGEEHIYRDLARRGIDVHAYGVPDASLPDFGSGQIHTTAAEEIERTWFVAFDGGPNEEQKTALIATERADNDWFGAWTYDGAIVDGLCTYLEETYRSPAGSTRLSE